MATRFKRNGLEASQSSESETEIATQSSQSDRFSDDGTRTFFWRAHTVLALILISSVLLYVTWWAEPVDTVNNVKRGVLAVVVIFILIGVIHMPDGPFVRPHPAIWRFALCIMIVYVLLLIFILFQSADDARQFLKFYDPELGVPLPEKTYADDCRIYTPGHPDGTFAIIMDKMDVFVAAHLFGWYVKALIIRDFWILTVLSVGFELLEYTLECQLPNFAECWWDHWILDFLVCNGLGIYLGMKTCEYLSIKTYHWSGLWKIPTLKGKLKRAVRQFTPYSWENFQWGYTRSFSRFVAVMFIISFWLLQDLNVFYLKTILWIPPNHSLNLYRIVLYGNCGACALNEMYTFLHSRDPQIRFGRFSWLCCIALIIETLIVIKFGWDILIIPVPRMILTGWALFFTALSIWAVWKFTVPLKEMPIIRNYFQDYNRTKKQN